MSKETSAYQTARHKAQPIIALPHWTHAELQRKELLCEQAEGHTDDMIANRDYYDALCESSGVWPTNQTSPEDLRIVTEMTNKTRQTRFPHWQQNDEFNVGEITGGDTYWLTCPEFLLSTVKVKVHVQALHKLRDRVFIGVGLLQK